MTADYEGVGTVEGLCAALSGGFKARLELSFFKIKHLVGRHPLASTRLSVTTDSTLASVVSRLSTIHLSPK